MLLACRGWTRSAENRWTSSVFASTLAMRGAFALLVVPPRRFERGTSLA